MADNEFNVTGSWWRGASKDRFDGGAVPASIFSSPGQHGYIMGSGSLFCCSTACTDSGSITSDAAGDSSSVSISSPIEWNINQPLISRERGEVGFRSLLQESGNPEEPSYEMDQAMFGSPSAILQSTLENSPYPGNTYGLMRTSAHELLPPLMTRTSPPENPPNHHLRFSNNDPFWDASVKSSNVRSSFAPFASLQRHQPFPTDEKPKKSSKANASNNIGSGTSSKRTRNEAPSPLPVFKVRKEKMGDRITALQQLVSPFGKTDTASVLSEAIEYIKILHEQVNVLSAPYMRSGASIHHHHQGMVKKEGQEEHEEHDLRSRGLCLVPVASTFPVTHETTQLDFWSPSFGGPFR